jgi:hypothetical protein
MLQPGERFFWTGISCKTTNKLQLGHGLPNTNVAEILFVFYLIRKKEPHKQDR